MTEGKNKIVCFGEVLWDVFADGKKIGGAPLNVALRMKNLGCDVTMISCVGEDADGEAILDYLSEHGLTTKGISKTADYPTGTVQVFINERGSASYDISYPSAWDKIILKDETHEFISNADALIYGSLICRDEVSRSTLAALLENKIYKVFDVNLRKPHYKQEILEELMHGADFIKFNDEELLDIAAKMGSAYTSLKENVIFISARTNTKAVCVTMGKHGAMFFWNDTMYTNPGYPAKVVDTVGAGDSFLGTLIQGVLSGNTPQKSLDRACAVGALVAEQPGANPEISQGQIEMLMMQV